MKRIFISYAREDIVIAERLFSDLQKIGADPWMDIKKLLPGQNWDMEIHKAIQSATFFFALISKQSYCEWRLPSGVRQAPSSCPCCYVDRVYRHSWKQREGSGVVK
jgi:TIR domain